MIKILIIEDDGKMRNLYQRAFSLSGYEVYVSKNGSDGLAAALKVKPNVILLDIMMPKMNGIQVIQKLKADPKTASIPVIMLTNVTSGTLQGAEKAVAKGAERYIIKSDHEPEEVVKMTEDVLNKNKAKGEK